RCQADGKYLNLPAQISKSACSAKSRRVIILPCRQFEENAMTHVPVIDLTPYRTGADKQGVARAINEACEDTGFLLIAGHGIDDALIAEMERVSHAFFDRPVEEKIKVRQPAPDVLRGYIGVAGESLARSLGIKAAGDLNESLMLGRADVPDDPYYR